MSARAAVPRYRPQKGTALFRQGFRPFFLAAGLWAATAVPLWLLVLNSGLEVPTAFAPAAWHGHEMIFGFAGAVVAGFLLTAIPNWTGRLPLQGLPLASLFAVWLAGRIVMAASAATGAGLAMVLDTSFLGLLLLVALREIVAGRNWRNLPMLGALLMLIAANVLMHLEVLGVIEGGQAGQRLGIAVLVLLICLIGGRIIPSFTRNWLVNQGATKLPAPLAGYDKLCLLFTLAALGAWVVLNSHPVAGSALLAAGGLNLLRLARWQGRQTLSEPLVWSLHLGFLWVPLGLLLLGLGITAPAVVPVTAGLHALTVGAIGGMTLAVMTRATLGHSGRELKADAWTAVIYICVAGAALLRIAASARPDIYPPLVQISGAAWTTAFGLFVIIYGRIQLSR